MKEGKERKKKQEEKGHRLLKITDERKKCTGNGGVRTKYGKEKE